MKIEICKCTQKDVEAVGAFYDREVLYMDESGTNYPLWTYKVYPSLDSVAERTREGCQYFCTLNGEICGAFVLNDNPGGNYENGSWKKTLKTGEYLVIHTLLSDHKLAGMGIATLAVKFCIKTAKAQGYKAVRIDVVPENTPAIRLYEKLGFSFAGKVDLGRNIKEIPYFSLYEYNFED